MMPRDTTLSVRAEEVRLRPVSSEDKAPWTRLLSAEAHGAAWRLLEVSSRDAQPFDLELFWSAGDGSGARARVSVATATRIAVFARHLEVRGRTSGRTEARVALHIADGFAPTHNVWATTVGVMDAVAVPPFAQSVVAHLTQAALMDDAFLVLDGPDGVVAEVRLDRLTAPLPVAGATRVRLRASHDVAARLCFHLCL